jgi:urease accessory protein
MKPARRLSVIALALLAAGPALAHPGHGGDSLMAGLAHPFSGADHLLAMTAVGLMAAQRGGRAMALWPAAFVGAMLAGYGLGVAAPGAPLIEPGVLASVMVLGALTAAQVQTPLTVGAALIGAFGLCHGYAHGAEGAPGAGFPVGFTLSTLALHGAGLVMGLAARRMDRPLLVRVAGAGVAAGGLLLVLAA